jgi:hypothetical protein
MARTSNYALRLLASVKAEAEKVAAAEGTTLNQFINVAVAEKLAVLRTARYFQERAARADLDAFDRLLAQAGNEPPQPGDEVEPESAGPRSAQRSRRSRKTNQRRQGRGRKPILRARLT